MEQKLITLNRDFIEDCLWMSIRYCVGRHTITASMHAADIAEFLRDNPDIISDERKKRLAFDIRREISDRVHFHLNMHVDGTSYKWDAVTLMSKKISEILEENKLIYSNNKEEIRGTFNPIHYRWYINVDTGEVHYEKYDKKELRGSIPFDYDAELMDFLPWMRLAGWLDPTVYIEAGYNGEEISGNGFEYPSVGRYQGEDHMHFKWVQCPCDAYIKNPHIQTYVIGVKKITQL